MSARVEVLIPTYRRPCALAVTLAGLAAQTYRPFDVLISDQSDDSNACEDAGVRAALRVLQAHGSRVRVRRHLPRRGMAEQRQFLLDLARAPYVLYLDDDVLLEPWVLALLHRAIDEQGCGFVGNALIGLSYAHDVRPHEQDVELWEGRVLPERVLPSSRSWRRHRLHNAANLLHVQRRLGATPESPRLYRVAWIGGCVMYRADRLRDCGGFDFWRALPEGACGEDVLAQLRVMAHFGGAGLMPSGAYHQELPTTLRERAVNAPKALCHLIDARAGAKQGEAC